MPTFTRKVEKLDAEDRDGLSAVAYTAHWRVTCNDDASVTRYGAADLGAPDPDNFTALADVTEAQARVWLGEAFWAAHEAGLAAQYAAQQAATETSKEF